MSVPAGGSSGGERYGIRDTPPPQPPIWPSKPNHLLRLSCDELIELSHDLDCVLDRVIAAGLERWDTGSLREDVRAAAARAALAERLAADQI